MKLQNLSQKLISDHLISGKMSPGNEIALKIDQVLLQDATGTLVMLELEAFNLNKIKAEVAVQYVDHNLLHRLLRGPRFAHWNNAEIGSHLRFDRKPDVFERGLYHCLCFLHS